MNESVLLYNVSLEQREKLTKMFLIMGVRMIFVESSQYSQSIGQLLGNTNAIPKKEDVEYAKTKDISTTMMVMNGFDNSKLDMVLKGFHQNKIPAIAYKAIVTPYNVNWTSVQLYEELQKEHMEFLKTEFLRKRRF